MSTSVADLAAHLRLDVNKGSFVQGEKLIHSIHHALEAFIGFEALKKVGEFFTSVVEGAMGSAHGIEVLSQQIGIAVKPLQELEYAAKVTGASTEALSTGMGRFAMTVAQANKGSKEAKQALQGLGPETMKLLKAGAPLEDVLGAVADKFKSMPDGTAKTALAMENFGRGGKELIPFLNKGKAGLKELREEAERLGIVMTGDTVKGFNELHESTIRLGAVWDGIKLQIATELLPTVRDIADGVFKWISANRALIGQKIHDYVERFVDALPALWAWLQKAYHVIADDVVPAFAELGKTLWWVIDHLGGLEVAAGAMFAVWSVKKIWDIASGIASWVTALKEARTAALALKGITKLGGVLELAETGADTAAAAGAGTGTAATGVTSGLGVAAGEATLGATLGTIAVGLAAGGVAGTVLAHGLGQYKSDPGYNDDYVDPRVAQNRSDLLDARYDREMARANAALAGNFSITVNTASSEPWSIAAAIRKELEQVMRDTHAAVAP